MASTTYVTKVVVTGANQGIGFEISKKLAKEHSDYHVILAGRNKAAVDKAVADLQAQGLTNTEPLILDVTSDESIAAAAAAVASKHGRLDVLVNNAGRSIDESGPDGARDLARDKWDAVFQVNVFGAALVTEAFWPLLEKSRAPARRVVFVSSSVGSLGMLAEPSTKWRKMPYGIYAASKSALNMVARKYSILKEDDPTWKINLCCPGHCSTNITGFMEGIDTPEQGAINACRLATLGIEGESGTFTDRHGTVQW